MTEKEKKAAEELKECVAERIKDADYAQMRLVWIAVRNLVSK